MATYEEGVPRQRSQRSWLGRNWWWMLLLVIIAAVAICCVLYFGWKDLTNKKPYQMTLEAVRNDPLVVKTLGEPIKDGWLVSVRISGTDNQGEGMVMIPISGPKGTADVRSNARRIDGKWGLTRVEVTFSDGQRHLLELDEEAAGGLEAPPPWVPPGELPPGSMPPDAGQ